MPVRQLVPDFQAQGRAGGQLATQLGNIGAQAFSQTLNLWEQNQDIEKIYSGARQTVLNPQNVKELGFDNGREAAAFADWFKPQKSEDVATYKARVQNTMSNIAAWDAVKETNPGLELPDPTLDPQTFRSVLGAAQQGVIDKATARALGGQPETTRTVTTQFERQETVPATPPVESQQGLREGLLGEVRGGQLGVGAAGQAFKQASQFFPQQQKALTPYQQARLSLDVQKEQRQLQQFEHKKKMDAATQRHRERVAAKDAGKEKKSDLNIMVDDFRFISSELTDLQDKIRFLTTKSEKNLNPMPKESLIDELKQEAFLKGMLSSLLSDIKKQAGEQGRTGTAGVPSQLERDFSLPGGGEGPLQEGDVRFRQPETAQVGQGIQFNRPQLEAEIRQDPEAWAVYQRLPEDKKAQALQAMASR